MISPSINFSPFSPLNYSITPCSPPTGLFNLSAASLSSFLLPLISILSKSVILKSIIYCLSSQPGPCTSHPAPCAIQSLSLSLSPCLPASICNRSSLPFLFSTHFAPPSTKPYARADSLSLSGKFGAFRDCNFENEVTL